MKQARNHDDLLQAIRDGARPEFVFFWGHTPLAGGEIGKPCLSQWWPASFTVDGIPYPTAEHFMMAEKARVFGDDDTRARILTASHPREVKELGRQVRGFESGAWEEVRSGIVVRGNLAKFGQNPDLLAFLLQTRDSVLVEASPVDRIWGIGLAESDPHAGNPELWRGLNLLGFALMEVRHQLRASDGARD